MKQAFPLLLVLAFAIPLSGQPSVTESFTAGKDNTVFSEAEDSNGAGAHLFVGRTLNGPVRRALISFDVSSIPQGATVESVRLILDLNRTRASSSDIDVHLLTADWGEAGSNASGNEGRGTAASTGDATWNAAFFGSTAWASPGGDFVSQSSATTTILGTGTATWTSAQMVADVQGWLDDGSSNFGWILIGDETNPSARRFGSSEGSNGPVLEVTYAVSDTPTDWAGFPIGEDGRTVDTGGFLGLIDIENGPWIWAYQLESYILLPEENVSPSGGWLYIPKPE